MAKKLLRGEREFDRQMFELLNATASIEAGRADHLFADAETKQAMLEDLKAQAEAMILKFTWLNPEQFAEATDGTISAPLKPESN